MTEHPKGNRRGRPPMRGSATLRPRSPIPEPPPFEGTRAKVAQPSAPAASGASSVAGSAAASISTVARKRVLFVCIGNSCRSQMAEAFSKAYGSDVIDALSAGVSPAPIIAPLTRKVVADRGVGMADHFPKGLETVPRNIDVLVNMSGLPLAIDAARVLRWPVPDPIGHDEATFRAVAAQIEDLVVRLILELRAPMRSARGSP